MFEAGGARQSTFGFSVHDRGELIRRVAARVCERHRATTRDAKFFYRLPKLYVLCQCVHRAVTIVQPDKFT